MIQGGLTGVRGGGDTLSRKGCCAAGGASNRAKKEGVHIVHTLGFGPGRISAGLGRIGDVFGGVADLQGLESGSSPTSGTCFPCSGACEPLSVHKLFT